MEYGNLHSSEFLDLRNCVRLEKLPNSLAKLATLKNIFTTTKDVFFNWVFQHYK